MMLPALLAGLPAPGNCCPKGLASLAVAHVAISEGQSAAPWCTSAAWIYSFRRWAA